MPFIIPAGPARRGGNQPARRRPNPGGRRWAELVRVVLATCGTTCHLCDHPGATGADHLVPVSQAPQLRWALGNLRPAHSGRHPCPVCHIACNEVRHTRPVEEARRIIAERARLFRAPLGGPAKSRRRRVSPGRRW